MREVFRHTIRNEGDQPLSCRLEPWGETFVIHPGAELVFSVSGRPDPPAIEAHWSGNGVVLYGTTGSVVHAFHGDREVGSGYEARA